MNAESQDFPTRQVDPQRGSASSLPDQTEGGVWPDALLRSEIEERLWKDSDLRSLEAGHIRVQVRKGIARLYGHVAKALNRSRAGEIGLAVPGIGGVQNELVVDEELRVQVAVALARDERTRPYLLLVVCHHGWINLGGTVPDAETQAAAGAVAASVPEVRGVIGLPLVPGGGISASRRAYQPEIGWSVYREGGVGSVEEVIIDPCSRLVTHLVVVENRPGYEHQEPREVLLPLDLIDFTREGAVWLKAGVDYRDYPGFDPGEYPLAPGGWRPPFPYDIGTVRWVNTPGVETLS